MHSTSRSFLKGHQWVILQYTYHVSITDKSTQQLLLKKKSYFTVTINEVCIRNQEITVDILVPFELMAALLVTVFMNIIVLNGQYVLWYLTPKYDWTLQNKVTLCIFFYKYSFYNFQFIQHNSVPKDICAVNTFKCQDQWRIYPYPADSLWRQHKMWQQKNVQTHPFLTYGFYSDIYKL